MHFNVEATSAERFSAWVDAAHGEGQSLTPESYAALAQQSMPVKPFTYRDVDPDLQLGARDVAFPTLNSVSFWLTATGALLVNASLVVGEFARAGWLPYPPLSEPRLFNAL